jgi:hypothetical protein
MEPVRYKLEDQGANIPGSSITTPFGVGFDILILVMLICFFKFFFKGFFLFIFLFLKKFHNQNTYVISYRKRGNNTSKKKER